jgi:hypothetical protein
VHYGFGAAWGGLYGLIRESSHLMRGPLGAALFGTGVWGIAENLILPAFRLSPWPNRFPPKVHAYAWLAHLVYAGGVWGTYLLLSPRANAIAGAALWDVGARMKLGPRVPEQVRHGLFGVIDRIARLKAREKMVRQMACALEA